ncbi:MAG: OsmC family protein [Anaerolineaceae bacterium]|jgi:putative redox protein|nr:OsmC family protein [Anaerolineaceae bacterium]
MNTTTVRWIGGEQFVGTDSTNHSIVLSTTDAGTGMKPSELLIIALASCTAVDVVSILEKKRKKITGLEIIASFEQDKDPPWAFRKIHLKYLVSGSGLTEKDVTKAIELSESKYCSVSATVRGVAEITNEFEIISEN